MKLPARSEMMESLVQERKENQREEKQLQEEIDRILKEKAITESISPSAEELDELNDRLLSAHKADKGGAPVYSYVMTYGAPQAVHGAEIPLIFDNTSAENEEIASIMRGVWAQFARTGDPAIEGFPKWEAFTRENGAVMVLDRVPYLNEQHDATLIGLLKPGYEW